MKHRPRQLSYGLFVTLFLFGVASGEERIWPQVRSAEDRFKQLDKSGGALEAHFGLGEREQLDVRVTLLNGTITTFKGVKADRFLALDVRTSQVRPVRTKP